MTNPVLMGAIPVLRSFDEGRAKDFYCGYLGFAVAWEHRFEPGLPLYMEVRLGGLVLHLSEHHGDGSPGARVFAPVKGVDALRRELEARSYAFARPSVESMPWGRQMDILDPFGNRICFCERGG